VSGLARIGSATSQGKRTKVVVIGGGIAGCSVAYHLTRLGTADVILVEQDELTSGSTWHAAGLCTHFIESPYLMRLLQISLETYARLEAESDYDVSFHACGSLRLATAHDRLDQFERVGGIAEEIHVPFEVVGPDRVQELFPLIDPHGLVAAAYLPTDGHIDPSSVTQALAAAATGAGVQILRHTKVSEMHRDRGTWRLATTAGPIVADLVLNAGGQWARELGRLVNVELPINSLEHHYVVTEPLPGVAGLSRELPVLRDPDGSYYVRQEGDALIVGPFEREPRPWGADGIPEGFHGRLLPARLDRIEANLVDASRRVPLLERAGLKTMVNGPDGFTPDGRCLMGPVAGVPGYHVLAGFSIFGIVFAGGAGRYAAEWLLSGEPPDDLWALDVSRFGPYASSTRYVISRARDVYEREYAIKYPDEERPVARPLKTTPLHDRLLEKGAVFGERFGWERPLWFAKGAPARDEYSFKRGNWFDAVGEECRAVRTSVGVLDQTSFAKFEISGHGAEEYLDRLCANTLPSTIGRICLTQMCTSGGGIQCDVTLTRLAEDRFYVVSAAAAEHHDLAWLLRHLPDDSSVRIENVTSHWGVLTVAGPRSRDLLSQVTSSDCANDAFPFFTCKRIDVGMAPARALRVSYSGELGYELHHPLEYQRHVYDQLFEAGEQFGLVDYGYRALEALRLEKGYRLWGVDLSTAYTPLEAGMERFVALDKRDFIGRAALVRQKKAGVQTKLASMIIEADGLDPHGYEPVRAAGEIVGHLASGGFAYTLGVSVGAAYLPQEHTRPGSELQIKLLGSWFPAVVAEQPLYDPGDTRLRG
jgi:dimethylglycine dehydrogenase